MMIAIYVLCILASNVLSAYHLISFDSGLTLPLGTVVFAPIFTLRDTAQHRRGERIVLAIVLIGTLLTILLAQFIGDATIARVSIARLCAFVAAELLDLVILHALPEHHGLSGVLASNTIACAIYSALFVAMAFEFTIVLFAQRYLITLLISALVGGLLVRRRAARQ